MTKPKQNVLTHCAKCSQRNAPHIELTKLDKGEKMYQLRKVNLNLTSQEKAVIRLNGREPMEGDIWSTHKTLREALRFKRFYMGNKNYIFRIRRVED